MEPYYKLILGLFTGLIFGFFLQKGRVAKLNVIVGGFLLKDFTAVKIMSVAAGIGSLGVYFMVDHGLVQLHLKEAQIGGIILGGILFGVGIVLYGYCPGTGVAAAGEGHKDALVGALGMLLGAMAYVYTFPFIEGIRKQFPDLGKVTLPEVTNSSYWLWAIGLAIVIAASSLLAIFKKKRSHPLT